MDAGLAAAARALAEGDVLGALRWVSVRSDPPALAMRGIAMARLGELESARELLRRAARAFTRTGEALARARCVVAAAEIDLADRRLVAPSRARRGRDDAREIEAAARALERAGDVRNASWALIVDARRAIAVGDLAHASRSLARARGDQPLVVAVRALAECEIALRRLDAESATGAAACALAAARAARAPALEREIEATAAALEAPVARVVRAGRARVARMRDLAALERTRALVVDLCRRRVGSRDLRTRPVPLAIARELALAWPGAASRATLLERVFGARRPNDSHRARLRVEIARTRALTGARIVATEGGFRLVARDACVLSPLDDSPAGDVLALLSQGGAWPASSLAAALGKSARTVQRALAVLERDGRATAVGRGRAKRWVRRSEIASHMLLPGLLVAGP